MKIVLFLIFAILFGGTSLNSYGESIDDMHNSALKYMNTQNFVQAIQEYSKILEVEPEDETALLNRAFAFTMINDHESGVKDLNKVLENDPKNTMALKGIATLLAQFECESYDNCRPNEALELLDIALEDNPYDEDLKMKRDFLLSKAETFDVLDTNGDYIVNIQFITRDQNGTLVSVIENAGTSVLPSRILEKHLDEKEDAENTIGFKKEVVEIGGQDYIKWHIEKKFETENDRFWRGAVSLEKRVEAKSDEGYDVLFFKEILRAIIPAQGYDVGYETVSIMEVFKKI
jgi:tetratricopeptide (TPR) repeat protein